jgi:hypothetical protein
MTPSIQNARDIISNVNCIITDPSTIHGTRVGIGVYNVIIVIYNPHDIIHSYIIATYTPGDIYPLEGEHVIHRERTLVETNQQTSPDGVRWVMEGTQCFHDPSNTEHPHILVDGVHVIMVELPTFDNAYAENDDYGADDGSSWDEGSIDCDDDFSEADTASVVSDEGDESIDRIQQILPTSTCTHIRETVSCQMLKRYINMIRQYPEKRWIRWYVFFAYGNRLHTCNDEFLHIARILKYAVWTCSHHSYLFQDMSYDECVKHIVNAICEK